MPDGGSVGTHKRAKVFMHGGSQAVRLPKEFRFDCREVEVVREGAGVLLRPTRRTRSDLWARIDRRRGNETLEYPSQPMLDEKTFDRDP
jgi:antitoxin VapB